MLTANRSLASNCAGGSVLKKHYFKVLDFAEEYAKRLLTPRGASWQMELLEDLQQPYLLAESNAHPRNLYVIGKRCLVSVCQDQYRPDALFVTRVEGASGATHLRRFQPDDFQLVLCSGRLPQERLDKVDHLFRHVYPSPEPEPARETADHALGSDTPLNRCLQRASEELREAWRPKNSKPISLDELRTVWARHRLDRVIRAPDQRTEWILSGRLDPGLDEHGQLKPSTRAKLLSCFGYDNLQRLGHKRGLDDLSIVLLDLAVLPLPLADRSVVWAEILIGLSGDDLRRELYAAKGHLHEALSDPGAEELGTLLVAVMHQVASAGEDLLLSERAATIEAAADPLRGILAWVDELMFAPPSAPQVRPTPKPLEVAPADQANPAPLDPEVFDSWVLGLRFPNQERLAEQVRLAETSLTSAFTGEGSVLSVRRLSELASRICDLSEAVSQWKTHFPSVEALQADVEEARDAFTHAQTHLGADLEHYLEQRVSPAELKEIATIYEDRDLLSHLPDWYWQEQSADAIAQSLKLQRLEDRVRRLELRRLLSRLKALPIVALPSVSALPPHGEESGVEAYLCDSLERLAQSSELLASAKDLHLSWIAAGQREGVTTERLERLLDQVLTFEALVSDEALRSLAEIMNKAGSQDERELVVAKILHAARHMGPAAKLVGYEVLAQIPVDYEALDDFTVTLEHSRVDGTGNKAPLYYRGFSERSYGFVTAPLELRTSHRRPFSLTLTYEYDENSDLTRGWPKQYDRPSPERLRIEEHHWREDKDRYHFTFGVTVPLRPPPDPLDGQEPLTLSIKATDGSGSVVVPLKALKWEAVLPDPGPVQYDWPDRLETDFVTNHPVGPQTKRDPILRRLRNGSSFAVVAPRRFGKSTLAQSLTQADEATLLIPEFVPCGPKVHQRGSPVRDNMWRRVSDNLEKALGVGLDLPNRISGFFPEAGAFEPARRAAHERGYSAIVLIFDEAQRFFPRRAADVGDEVKDLLEKHLTQTPPGLSRVLFGFVGLLSLRERWGQLGTILNPSVHQTLAEGTLNRIILKMTMDKLHTTREARTLLAERARNLLVLKKLLQRLVDYLNSEQRNWANYDDVAYVYGQLKHEVERLQDREVLDYIRDALNESDSPSTWEPRASYPLAVALAAAHTEHSGKEAVAAAVDQLNLWCAELSAGSSRRLEYNEARVDEHLTTLMNLGLYARGTGFKSDLLAAWLRGESEHFPSNQQDRGALLRGAMARVKLPATYEPMKKAGEGSEALVFRFVGANGRPFALRQVRLPTQEARQRFQESSDALSVLKKRIALREESSEFVYELQEVGLAEHDDGVGVQIYPWVEGAGLETRLGQLSAPLVADLAWKLAKGLRFVHFQNVLHRDLRPANIVLSDPGARPVIIDFGMARLDDSRMGTSVSNPAYAAPEVQRSPPNWDRPADIYSLGAVLRDLLRDRKESPPLDSVIRDCLSDNPATRPTAEDLVDRLDQVRESLKVDREIERINEELDTLIAKDRQVGWFKEEVFELKIRADLVASKLGLWPQVFDRCVVVANMLNHILEAKWKVSLGKLRHQADDPLRSLHQANANAITSAVRLRNFRSHSGRSTKEEVLLSLNRPDSGTMIRSIAELAAAIGQESGLASLSSLADYVLRG